LVAKRFTFRSTVGAAIRPLEPIGDGLDGEQELLATSRSWK